MMSTPDRVIAVDWSGDARRAKKKIWRAKVGPGGISELEDGQGRENICGILVDELAHGPNLVAGLDFAFSFPAWFVEDHGCSKAIDFWRVVKEAGEAWMSEKQDPFFERGSWQDEEREPYRVTERQQKKYGWHPETVFRLIGQKQVGKGSIRGMPWLLRLKAAGFNIWPFDAPELPLLVEIFPRLLYGGVNKSSIEERYRYLTRNYPGLRGLELCKAAGSDDAFDAATSAFKMWENRSRFTSLPTKVSAQVRIEGWIWDPSGEPPTES